VSDKNRRQFESRLSPGSKNTGNLFDIRKWCGCAGRWKMATVEIVSCWPVVAARKLASRRVRRGGLSRKTFSETVPGNGKANWTSQWEKARRPDR
jgi:hypothetical protein